MSGYCFHYETCLVTSPIGDMRVNVCSAGLHGLRQVLETDEDFAPDLSIKVQLKGAGPQEPNKEHITALVFWLKSYFLNPSNIKLIPCPQICKHAIPGEFSKTVSSVLKDLIFPGDLITYGELAESSSYDTKYARAVGGVMADNPLQIIVPCHRVVPISGSLGQYARGKKNSVKKWLLEFEGIKFDEYDLIINPRNTKV